MKRKCWRWPTCQLYKNMGALQISRQYSYSAAAASSSSYTMAGFSSKKSSRDTDPTPSWRWTNEKHERFLNSIEDTFVRTMLESNARLPKLDRYLPDTSESTEDLVKERRRRNSTSNIIEPSLMKTEKKNRVNSAHISSHDQVVPQFQKIKGDKDDGDDLGVPH